MEQKKAFTLVELLVSLLVILVLLFFLLPSVTHCRTLSKKGVCLAHLKGLWLCSMMYADDHNSDLPMAQVVYPESEKGKPETYIWYRLLAPYAGEFVVGEEEMIQGYLLANAYDYSDLFSVCPEFTGAEDQLGYGMVVAIYEMDKKPPTSINDTQYLNWLPEGVPYETLAPAATGGEAHHRFFKRSEFSDTARRGWLGDSDHWNIGGGPETTPYDPENRLWPTWNDGSNPELDLGRAPERHSGTSNIVFLDGHARDYKYNVGGNAFYNIQQLPLNDPRPSFFVKFFKDPGPILLLLGLLILFFLGSKILPRKLR